MLSQLLLEGLKTNCYWALRLWACAFRTLLGRTDRVCRQTLHSAIVADPEISLVADCTTSTEVVRAMSEHCPSLMFLDVQMCDLNFTELCEACDSHAHERGHAI
jgi:DNA-binding NarL/FixJ family response regulator